MVKMKLLLIIMCLLFVACETKNYDFIKAGESRHGNWTLEYQTTVGELYFCTYIRSTRNRGYAFTTPSETPCKEIKGSE